jgi:predicted nucleic acid-binding protein
MISLERLPGGFQWFAQLYERLLLPDAVLEELAAGGYDSPSQYLGAFGIEDLVIQVQPSDPNGPPGTDHLHRGERHALQVAIDRDLELLVEEEAGRHAAQRLAIPYSGIAGQLLVAVDASVLSRDEARRALAILFEERRINEPVRDTVASRL